MQVPKINKPVQICGRVRLSYKLDATAIYIDSEGGVIITADRIPLGTKPPHITLEWLETMCMNYTLAAYGQAYLISDALAAEGAITYNSARTIYQKIQSNLDNGKVLIVSNGS